MKYETSDYPLVVVDVKRPRVDVRVQLKLHGYTLKDERTGERELTGYAEIEGARVNGKTLTGSASVTFHEHLRAWRVTGYGFRDESRAPSTPNASSVLREAIEEACATITADQVRAADAVRLHEEALDAFKAAGELLTAAQAKHTHAEEALKQLSLLRSGCLLHAAQLNGGWKRAYSYNRDTVEAFTEYAHVGRYEQEEGHSWEVVEVTYTRPEPVAVED